ncbi:glycosyltransferase family 2 protein [Pedobacter sp. JY14-1]|uniref:glycosyltransferase family 2 protein n=1 Tax=Pedobacter sp. JY14-1 TaxID=3034151 RepID=UPI0023E0D397|nr:glycosyltransferase family 2 protein [Pedobacter sp. JY14-1]
MNTGSPLVSIITVTYNAGDYLQRCINSITAHAPAGTEYIIIDGSSTDNTLDIIRNNAAHITYWESGPDEGIYDAMNKALRYAKGAWIYFLGADDRLKEGFTQMLPMLRDTHTLYHGTALCGDSMIGRSSYDAYQVASLNLCHQTIFYPRLVFDKYRYETKYKVRADHYLNMLCFADRELKLQFYPYTICDYHPGGFSSATADPAFDNDLEHIIRENFGYWTLLRYKLRIIRHRIKGKNSR